MMMHRVSPSNAIATELQNAAALRRNQAASAQAASAQTTPTSGAQYNFAEIFGGSNWGQTVEAAAPSSKAAVSMPGGFHSAIATATAVMVDEGNGTGQPVRGAVPATPTTPETATETATTSSATEASTATSATAEATASSTAAATNTPAAATVTPGVEALVTAIMNGSFQPSYQTSPSQLQEITPAGTDYMPSFYYASSQTAQQMAQLLGGTVVQSPAFGSDKGWSEPSANFIQLPSGQTFNAADVAYYAKSGSQGTQQLTADITAAINQGAAWTNYYHGGGAMPTFAMGYVGPPIAGSTYPSGMIGADGNVINPAMQQASVKGT